MRISINNDAMKFSERMALRVRRIPSFVKRENIAAAAEMLSLLKEFGGRGRPGPEEHTGAFVSNMTVKMHDDGYGFDGFNLSPQAERLEHGFVGVDSLGRHYRQPAYPWRAPAFEAMKPRYAKRMAKALRNGVSIQE